MLRETKDAYVKAELMMIETTQPPDSAPRKMALGRGFEGPILPSLAPAFPLTFSLERRADHGLWLRCDHLLSHACPAIVDTCKCSRKVGSSGA